MQTKKAKGGLLWWEIADLHVRQSFAKALQKENGYIKPPEPTDPLQVTEVVFLRRQGEDLKDFRRRIEVFRRRYSDFPTVDFPRIEIGADQYTISEDQKAMVDVVKTPPGIGTFLHVFTPKPVTTGGEPRFSLNILFSPDQQKTPEFKALKVGLAEAAKDEFGPDYADMFKSGALKSPIRNAKEKDWNGYHDAEEGTVFINAWSKTKPGIVDAQRNEILDPQDIFAGQLMRISCRPFAYDRNGNKGVSFALNNIQVLKKDMPRLDGKISAKAEFDVVDMGDDADDAEDFPF